MVRLGPHSDGPACIARLVHPIAMPLNVALLLTPLIVHNIVFKGAGERDGRDAAVIVRSAVAGGAWASRVDDVEVVTA